MPIYEYRCLDCGSQQQRFFRGFADAHHPRCQACASDRLQRLVSRFAIARTIAAVHEATGPARGPADLDYYRDPRNIGRWTEQQAERLGVELPASVRTMIDAAREGELPPPVSDL